MSEQKYRCRLVRHEDGACAFAEPFWKMQDEGLADVVMYDAVMPNIADWHSVTNPAMALLIRIENAQSGELVMVTWLNSFMGRVAMIHFCCFTAWQHDAEAIGRTALEYIFGLGVIDALIGITPAPYRHAISFVEKLGFVRKTKIPKACHFAKRKRYVDGVLTMLTREDFMNGGGE